MFMTKFEGSDWDAFAGAERPADGEPLICYADVEEHIEAVAMSKPERTGRPSRFRGTGLGIFTALAGSPSLRTLDHTPYFWGL